jgi:hypothetical protein
MKTSHPQVAEGGPLPLPRIGALPEVARAGEQAPDRRLTKTSMILPGPLLQYHTVSMPRWLQLQMLRDSVLHTPALRSCQPLKFSFSSSTPAARRGITWTTVLLVQECTGIGCWRFHLIMQQNDSEREAASLKRVSGQWR